MSDLPESTERTLKKLLAAKFAEFPQYPVEFWRELDCALSPEMRNWLWDVFDVPSWKHADMHGRRYLYQFIAVLQRHPELVGCNILYDLARQATRYDAGHLGHRDVYGKSFFEELEKLLLLKVECFDPWEKEQTRQT